MFDRNMLMQLFGPQGIRNFGGIQQPPQGMWNPQGFLPQVPNRQPQQLGPFGGIQWPQQNQMMNFGGGRGPGNMGIRQKY